MSAISSQLSFRSSALPWKFNTRVVNVMDSIYAIVFGLGLRALVDAVSQDFRLTGSLIGLWEGVITLHFLKKMPKSSDPYIAYAVRLFVDFLVTESVERLVLVLVWTAFGMVLADVAPGIWDEVGLKRVWRHFRRDLYTIYHKIPTVAFFPPPRTVRFLPPRERSISPSITASQDLPVEDTPIAVVPPSSTTPSEAFKRRVPGYYPGDYSDTDTDLGSTIRSRSRSRLSPTTEVNDALGTNHHRFSTMSRLNNTYSVSDLDEGNQSSVVSSPSFNEDDIPDMEEEQPLVDIEEKAVPERITTPKQKPYIPMPPTPSDSAARWEINRDRDIVEDAIPRRGLLPDISDSVEDGGTSDDWEKIQRGELDDDKPPTPPAKDKPNAPSSILIPKPPPIIPMSMGSPSTNLIDIDYSTIDSFAPQVPSSITDRRQSAPPAYTDIDDCEDMYGDLPPLHDKKPARDDDTNINVNEHANSHNNDNDNNNNDLDSDINRLASGTSTSFDAAAQAQEDAAKEEARLEADKLRMEDEERLRKKEERLRQEEEEERIRKEERIRQQEEERIRNEAEKALKKQLAEEAVKKRKVAEERRKKEADDDALRKQKQKEETKRQAEAEKRRQEEEAEKKRQEEEAKKKRQEEAEKKRQEEAEKKRQEEAEKKRQEEAEKKRQEEEAEKKRQEEAEKKRQEEEAEKKRQEEAEVKRKNDEAEQKRKEEEEEQKKEAEAQREAEKEETRKEREEADRTEQAKAQEELKSEVQQADPSGDQAHENEDDTKTLYGGDQNLETQQQHEQGPSETDIVQDPTTSPPLGDPTEEESAMSEVTTADPPALAKERLERMMILRAQTVELEKRLHELKVGGADEQNLVKAVEKSLRKHRRQAERRYAAGVPLANYLNDDDDVSLEGLLPTMAGIKLEEKLEQLLAPTSRSISFTLTFARKTTDAKQQKPIVVKFLTMYNLNKYTTEGPKKKASVKITEEEFAEWLIGYRALKAELERAEEDDDGSSWQHA